MEPDAPELRKRLPVLRLQKTKLDRFLLDQVAVDHDCVRLEGAAAVLKKLASRGPSKSSPEVVSFVREWRPLRDSNPCRRRERAVS